MAISKKRGRPRKEKLIKRTIMLGFYGTDFEDFEEECQKTS